MSTGAQLVLRLSNSGAQYGLRLAQMKRVTRTCWYRSEKHENCMGCHFRTQKLSQSLPVELFSF